MIVSATCATSHSSPSSTIERWIQSLAFASSKRALAERRRAAQRASCRRVGAAGPVVSSVARALDGAVAVDAVDLDGVRVSPYSLPLPWTSCSKWQSTQCIPFSRWMSLRWTALPNFCGSSCGTTLSSASSRLPLRSRLKTARKTQPWPWKSANCVCSSLGFNSGVPTFSRNSRSDQRPRCAAAFGVAHADSCAHASARILLLVRIHELAVGLVVPPHVAEVGLHHVRAGVHVARHALAGRDRRA